jgi:hypothetical protein
MSKPPLTPQTCPVMAVEVDDLADGSPAVFRAGGIALMDADLGAVTGGRQFGEELLRLFGVSAVPLRPDWPGSC